VGDALPPPPRALPARGRDRVLLLVLYAALAIVLAHAHDVVVDQPHRDVKLARHEATIENRERDPYQYKLLAITWAVEGVHRATGVDLVTLYRANGFLSLLALLLAHHLWVGRLLGSRAGVVGTLVAAALAHAFFLGYHHHPYEFWGVAGFCLLLSACGRDAPLGVLCAIALVTGLVWEKHALVPVLWGLSRWRAGVPFLRAAARAGLVLACALAWFVASRAIAGTDRPVVDVTALSEQRWASSLAHHGPVVLPFLAILLLARDAIPAWVRLAWWHVPVLFVAYAAARLNLDETRSYWAFVPVFAATAAAWAARLEAG
jgi:hypothetical protein